jgi:hypothetical protein
VGPGLGASAGPGADQQRRLAAGAWLGATVGLTAASLVAVVLLAPPAGAPPVQALSWLLFTGSSVHVASTGALFVSPAARGYARQHLTRCLWVPAGLVVATACAAAIVSPAAFQWALLPYFGWQFYHYQKQNLGVAALAAAASRLPPLRRAERQALQVTAIATIGELIADPRLLGLRINVGADWLHSVATAVFVIAVAAGIAQLARRPREARPGGFTICYLTALLFGLPAFVFSSPYAAVGGMTVAHGLQYLLLVGLVTGGTSTASTARYTDGAKGASGAAVADSANGASGVRSADRVSSARSANDVTCAGGASRAHGASGASRAMRLAIFGNVALIGGALLSTASHLHNSSPAGRAVFGAYLGVVMAHFVIDAGLWRMRDPLARKFITGHLPYLVPARSQPPPPTGSSPQPTSLAGSSVPPQPPPSMDQSARSPQPGARSPEPGARSPQPAARSQVSVIMPTPSPRRQAGFRDHGLALITEDSRQRGSRPAFRDHERVLDQGRSARD